MDANRLLNNLCYTTLWITVTVLFALCCTPIGVAWAAETAEPALLNLEAPQSVAEMQLAFEASDCAQSDENATVPEINTVSEESATMSPPMAMTQPKTTSSRHAQLNQPHLRKPKKTESVTKLMTPLSFRQLLPPHQAHWLMVITLSARM